MHLRFCDSENAFDYMMATWQYIDKHGKPVAFVVGWSMKLTLSRELALDALMIAVWRCKLDSEVIVHSDQGNQYGSNGWQRFCRASNLAPGISRRGNCRDNAVAESFFRSLKKERIR